MFVGGILVGFLISSFLFCLLSIGDTNGIDNKYYGKHFKEVDKNDK